MERDSAAGRANDLTVRVAELEELLRTTGAEKDGLSSQLQDRNESIKAAEGKVRDHIQKEVVFTPLTRCIS